MSLLHLPTIISRSLSFSNLIFFCTHSSRIRTNVFPQGPTKISVGTEVALPRYLSCSGNIWRRGVYTVPNVRNALYTYREFECCADSHVSEKLVFV